MKRLYRCFLFHIVNYWEYKFHKKEAILHQIQ